MTARPFALEVCVPVLFVSIIPADHVWTETTELKSLREDECDG